MRHARRKLRRLVRLAAAGGLVCGGLMVTDAVAGEPADGQGVADTVARLGTSRTAGSWTTDDGRTVVAVTDAGAAEEVRAAGADARAVPHSMDRLRAATEALRAAPRVAGTAWAVDYASNEVTVRADSTVSAADWSRMSRLAQRIGGHVRMERTQGTFATRVGGASPIFGERRCSAGFNVTDGTDTYILTAGHCGPEGTSWFLDRQGAELVGTTTDAAFPGKDYSLVRYESADTLDRTNVASIGGGRGVRIVGAAEAVVGQRVFRSGSTTGFRSGEVTAVNATVNYPEGTVTGLIETTVCAEPGDSGGPLFSEGLALGVTSGGDGDCASGGTTYFQPVTGAMEALGVDLTGGPPRPPGSGDGEGDGAEGAQGTQGTGGTEGAGATGGAGAGDSGAAGGSRSVTSIVDVDDPRLGLGVIAVSLGVLVSARWIVSVQERREYRSFHSASWG
ncbi:S1 family peptidase [Streptomyces sp. NPDC015127]|uniref:S1 family peptidase n=1 Tax=Streptomyces sp. NPDC015127 TaxID=3364939 RepID=UPI0036FEB6F2